MAIDPEGQTRRGTSVDSMPNPKTQPPAGQDGSNVLPAGSTSTGYPLAAGRNEKPSGGHVPGDDVVNEYFCTDQGAVPATTNASAGRVRRIDGGGR